MSNVRGPTSALTEFLRERGITARNTNRFRRRDQEQQEQAAAQAQAADATPDGQGSSASPAAAAAPSPSSARSRRSLARNGSSMNFEEDDETDDDLPAAATAPSVQTVTTTSSGRQTRSNGKRRAAESEIAAEASSNSNGKGKKKAKKGDQDDEDDYDPKRAATKGPAPSDWEDHLGLPQPSSSRANFSYANRTPGSIAYCGMCKMKFTITQYTKMGDKGPLCHRCGPLYKGPGGSSSDSKAKPASKKRQPRRKTMQDGLRQSFPSLQSYCIDVVSRHIEDVEALGLIGHRNMDAISKSISKNRSLNPRTLQLFLSPTITTLSLYDCSKLDSESLQSIATFAPNLEHINLQLCGMLDNDAIDAWAKRLAKLKSVELYGPFLVRKEAWHRFFEALGPRLESFKIRESPRFDLSCAESMVKHCPNLRELGLAQIGPLDKTMLKPLEAYGDQLTYLDVSDPGVSAPGIPPKSLEDDEVVSLLQAVGKNLVHLDVSKNIDLTDRVIKEAIQTHCRKLKTLRLIGCEKVEAETVASMFADWAREGVPGISHLHLDRMLKLDDSLVEPMLTHSGPDLIELSLNSVDGITDKGLEILANAKNLPALETLDLSFVRAVDDDSLDKVCRNLPNLKRVSVFGCNRISDFLKSDRVRIIGKEKYAF